MTDANRIKSFSTAAARMLCDPRATLLPHDLRAALADLPSLLASLDNRLRVHDAMFTWFLYQLSEDQRDSYRVHMRRRRDEFQTFTGEF